MNLTIRLEAVERLATEALALGILEGARRPTGAARAVDRATGGAIAAALDRGDFSGKKDQIAVLYPRGRGRAKRLILVGLGPEAELSQDRIRQAGGRAVAKARDLGVRELAMVVPVAGKRGPGLEDAAQALAEGLVLADYAFDRYRTKDKDKNQPVRSLVIVEPDEDKLPAVKRGAQRGRLHADAVCFARDLCNAPSLDMTPRVVAEQAAKLAAEDAGVKVTVLDEMEIEKLKMGALLGVARGTHEPPRFLVLEYQPAEKPKATLCLVGKGITFDSGGISLKPAEGMEKMKYDMSGAAAVLGVFHALRRSRPPAVRVVGLVPLTENMPGGHALKPGDVVSALNGMTVEVVNTDAEGRLILADALAYARRFRPNAVVDLATLTGAVVIALGSVASGLLGNDKGLIERVKQSAERSGERVWELPTWPDYAELLKSDIADIKNAGIREAGTIQGAMFLAPFIEGSPWVHLDIAGTAWTDKDKAYAPKGSTGIGVRLLLDLIESWSAAPASKS